VIPRRTINQLIRDRQRYGLSFNQMADYLRAQEGIQITGKGLQDKLIAQGKI